MNYLEKAEHLVRNHPANKELMELGFGCEVETDEPENEKEMASPDRFTATCLGLTNSKREIILGGYDFSEPFMVWNDEIEFARLNFQILGKPAHLEHYLRVLGEKGIFGLYTHGETGIVEGIAFNLTTGAPATEKDAEEFIKLVS